MVHSEAVVSPYSGGDVETLRGLGLSEEEIAQITGGTLDSDGKVTVTYVPSETVTDKQTEDASGQTAQQPADSETIVIPENPSQTQRVDYELTYYVNNVNTENTQVLMEYGRRDELKNVYTYGNERISVDTIADTFNAVTDDIQTDYYLYDGRGSVANVVTDSAEIIATYTYDPFGNVTSGAPEFDSFYGYNAEDTNPVTGLQYLRARYYDTEDGRFNVADTYLGDVSQPLTLNRYTYTVNNPVMQNDPSGHWPNWLDKAVDTVKSGAKKAANWVNDNVVKPVVNTAKVAASWVNDNVIQPAARTIKENATKFADNVSKTYDNAKQKLNEIGEKAQQGYQDIKQAASQKYQEAKTYVQQKCQEVRQQVIEFSCGAAEKLSNAWESTVNWWNNIEWDRVAQGALTIVGGAIVITVGAAAIAATGGAAAVAFSGLAAGAFTSANIVIAGTAIAGGAAVAFGTSDVIEGAQNIDFGLAGGTESAAFNPIRDAVFNNDILTPDMYYTTEMILSYGAAMGADLINQNRAYYGATAGKQSSMTTSNSNGGNGGDAATTQKPDFYVTPEGDVVPSTGYRYISKDASYLDDLQSSMTIPANEKGTYITFDNFNTANPGALQVPHDASIKLTFDTLQIIDDIQIPNGMWGKATYFEPIATDYPRFGPGGATQAITNSPIYIDTIKELAE